MTNLYEGQAVSYIGDGSDGRALGERGQLIAITGSSGHVKWADRSLTLVDLEDLGPVGPRSPMQVRGARDDLADSLDVGPVGPAGVRGVFESEGPGGVLASLHGTVQLASLGTIAAEALAFVEDRVREDVSFRTVTAQLDDEDAEEMISVTARMIIGEVLRAD